MSGPHGYRRQFNTREFLEQCLSSVRDQARGLLSEIVVVDNASTDGSAAMVTDRFPDVALIRNPENRGFAQAVNQGISASTGRHVLLINSDATMLAQSVHRMMEHLNQHPNAAAVGGMLMNPDGSFQGSFADFPTFRHETLLLTGLSRWLLPATFPIHSEAEGHQFRHVDWVCGAFMLLRRQALDEIGLFDEDYFMYAEEVDWCLRARRAGWFVEYLPTARAIHRLGASYGRVPTRRRAHLYRSKCLYLRKHLGMVTAAAYRRLVQLCSAAKLIAWGLLGVVVGPTRRERAHLNVASYRHLLCQF